MVQLLSEETEKTLFGFHNKTLAFFAIAIVVLFLSLIVITLYTDYLKTSDIHYNHYPEHSIFIAYPLPFPEERVYLSYMKIEPFDMFEGDEASVEYEIANRFDHPTKVIVKLEIDPVINPQLFDIIWQSENKGKFYLNEVDLAQFEKEKQSFKIKSVLCGGCKNGSNFILTIFDESLNIIQKESFSIRVVNYGWNY